MRSRLLFLTVLLIIICVSCRPKKKTEPEKKAVTGATYTNPLRERGAEPWAVFYEGKYYYTQGSESRIMLWETSDITNLNDSLRKPVWIPTDPAIPITYGPPKCIDQQQMVYLLRCRRWQHGQSPDLCDRKRG